MWIEAADLAITLATAVFGGGRLFSQFRRIDTVADLRKALKAIKAETAFLGQETDAILDFLKYSELIMGPLRSKLVRRLFQMLGYVFASATIPLVLVDKGVVTNEGKAWAVMVGFALLQVTSGVLTGKFFKPEESEFLKNSATLQDRFYDLYVLPAMHVFNNGVRTSTVLGPARDAGRATRSETPEYLQNIFKESLERQDRLIGPGSPSDDK